MMKVLAFLLLPGSSIATTFRGSWFQEALAAETAILTESAGNASLLPQSSGFSSSPDFLTPSNTPSFFISSSDFPVAVDALGALYGKEHVNTALDDKSLVRLPVDDARAIAEAAGSAASTAYGEITPDGLLNILERVDAKKGQRFYDLGSGAGKAVVTAWAMGMNATGIELSMVRFNASCNALAKVKSTKFNITSHDPMYPVAKVKLTHPSQMSFLHGSFTDIDWSDADIVFANSVFYSEDLMAQLTAVAGGMKKGTFFVSMKPLGGANWEQIGSLNARASWNHGEDTSWRILKKKTDRDTALLPQGAADTICSLPSQ